MTLVNRIVTYLIVLAAVLTLTWAMLPTKTYPPQGLLLPSKKTFAPVDVNNVRLVANNGSISGTNVGTINLETYAPTPNNAVIAETEIAAKLLAANAGANQVVVQQFGQAGEIVIFQAQAIRTN